MDLWGFMRFFSCDYRNARSWTVQTFGETSPKHSQTTIIPVTLRHEVVNVVNRNMVSTTSIHWKNTFCEWSPDWNTIVTYFLTYHLEVHMAYLFWHSFWHIFKHSFWHSMWHLFWYAFWHIFILTFFLVYLRRFFVVEVNTLIRSSRLRSGGEHFDPELAVEVRRGTLWSWACCSGPAGNTAI